MHLKKLSTIRPQFQFISVRLLVLCAIIIAVVQITTALNGASSRWKGGGFGMYTEPHPNSRRVWLMVIDQSGRTHPLMLWPVSPELRINPAPNMQESVAHAQAAISAAYRLATSGNQREVAEIKRRAKHVQWKLNGEGALGTLGREDVDVSSFEVKFTEIRYEIENDLITSKVLL